MGFEVEFKSAQEYCADQLYELKHKYATRWLDTKLALFNAVKMFLVIVAAGAGLGCALGSIVFILSMALQFANRIEHEEQERHAAEMAKIGENQSSKKTASAEGSSANQAGVSVTTATDTDGSIIRRIELESGQVILVK